MSCHRSRLIFCLLHSRRIPRRNSRRNSRRPSCRHFRSTTCRKRCRETTCDNCCRTPRWNPRLIFFRNRNRRWTHQNISVRWFGSSVAFDYSISWCEALSMKFPGAYYVEISVCARSAKLNATFLNLQHIQYYLYEFS